jgi:hypothetical protein
VKNVYPWELANRNTNPGPAINVQLRSQSPYPQDEPVTVRGRQPEACNEQKPEMQIAVMSIEVLIKNLS